MRTFRLLPIAFFLVLFLSACQNTPQVVQGTVLSYDKASMAAVVKDDLPPNRILTFSFENAKKNDEVGADPEPQDIVRIAYKDEGGKLVAIRVMNLTRQKELKSAGH